MGMQLALEHPIDADLVMPVPDTGAPAAAGFAEASGLPYREGMYRNRYAGRTFIQPSAGLRHRGVTIKLNPLREVVNGKRLIVVDDSIVRGTTTKRIVELLRKAGATEVHVRISAPPIYHPCFYGIDTQIETELIASTHTRARDPRLHRRRFARLPDRSVASSPRSSCRTSGSASPASMATTRSPCRTTPRAASSCSRSRSRGWSGDRGQGRGGPGRLPRRRRRRGRRRAGGGPDARPRRVDAPARGRRRPRRVRRRLRRSRPAIASRCSSPRPTASGRRPRSPPRSGGSTRSASTSSRCAPTTSSAAAPSRSPSSTTWRSAGSSPAWVAELVGSVAAGCRDAGCALVGGETAEHPGLMEPDAFDLSGCCIGVVERADAHRRLGRPRRRRDRRTGVVGAPRQRLLAGPGPARGVGPRARRAVPGAPAPVARRRRDGTGDRRRAARGDGDARRGPARPRPGSTPGPSWRRGPPSGPPDPTCTASPTSPAAACPATCRGRCRPAWPPGSTPPAGRCRRSCACSGRFGGLDDEELRATFNGGLGMVVVVPPDAVAGGDRRDRGLRDRGDDRRRGGRSRPASVALATSRAHSGRAA